MKQIVREKQMQLLLDLKDQDVVKVVTGIRRSGKSTLLQQFRDHLVETGIPEGQIFFANFEDIDNAKWLNDYIGFYEYLKSKLDFDKPCYVFLDEIQLMCDFEKLVDGLHIKPNIDVYITGSNAHILSSEMGTLLTGRYVTIHLLPFSFKEYIHAKGEFERTDLLFQEYLHSGGFPGTVGFDKNIQNMYISDIYNGILQKDILARNNWKKSENFSRIIGFMANSVGSEISVNTITNHLHNQGYEISNHTVDNYLCAITESYLFYKAPRFDVKGKKILSTGEKYYACDLGLVRMAENGASGGNLAHKLENVIYLELIRRGYSVWVGKTGNKQIDFVARDLEGETQYYQVAWSTVAEQTLLRELTPFNTVRDFNSRFLITMDMERPANLNGIRKVNAVDWLLGD